MRITSDSFFGSESAPQNWPHTECIEIIRRYDANACAFGAIADAQRRTGDAIDDERLKQRSVFSEINEIGIREPVVSRYPARRADKREHPVLMWHERIRPNQNSFDPTEHRGVGSNTECEAKNCQDGKARTASKHPEAEAKVLEKRLHLVNYSARSAIIGSTFNARRAGKKHASNAIDRSSSEI